MFFNPSQTLPKGVENILISDKKDLASVKLIDFGLSCHFNDYFVTLFSQKCGTLLYMAPELLKGELYSKVLIYYQKVQIKNKAC